MYLPAGSSLLRTGYALAAVSGLLIMVASLCAAQAGVPVGFRSCGARAYLPCGLWSLPRPGLEPGPLH